MQEVEKKYFLTQFLPEIVHNYYLGPGGVERQSCINLLSTVVRYMLRCHIQKSKKDKYLAKRKSEGYVANSNYKPDVNKFKRGLETVNTISEEMADKYMEETGNANTSLHRCVQKFAEIISFMLNELVPFPGNTCNYMVRSEEGVSIDIRRIMAWTTENVVFSGCEHHNGYRKDLELLSDESVKMFMGECMVILINWLDTDPDITKYFKRCENYKCMRLFGVSYKARNYCCFACQQKMASRRQRKRLREAAKLKRS